MQRKYLILFLIFWVKLASAQVTLFVSVEKDSMSIAEDNYFHIRLEHPSDVIIRSIDLSPLQTDPFEIMEAVIDTTTFDSPEEKERNKKMIQESALQSGNSAQVMEIKNRGTWEGTTELIIPGKDAKWKTKKSGNNIIKENSILFTMFEDGATMIFPPVIEYEQNSQIKTVTFFPGSVIVRDPNASADTTFLQPNKEILKEPIHILEDVLIPVGTFLLVVGTLVGLIILFLRKGKKDFKTSKKIARQKEVIPASRIAFEKLKKLRDEKMWQTGQVKEYQSQLTYVIREYLENRYDINALENTTFQIGQDLKSLNLEESLRGDLQNILQVADMVKFAKAKPSQDVHEQFLTKAEGFVQTTKKTTAQIEAEKAELERKYFEQIGKKNISNNSKYASPWDRFFAALIDSLFFSIIAFIILIVIYFIETKSGTELNLLKPDTTNIIFGNLAMFAISLFYFVFMEAKKGQTFGKMIVGIRTQNMDGSNMSFGKSLVRFILKSIAIIFLAIPYFYAFFNDKKQTLYDKFIETETVRNF